MTSGFLEKKYFHDIENIIIDIFSKKTIEEQPKYIVEMGCGDGAFLKWVYEIVNDKTARGEFLAETPLKLIGADCKKKSLEEADKNLVGFPHMVIHGDINDPEQLISDLREKGIYDPENILHIRSFLDHNISYNPPVQKNSIKNSIEIQYEGLYVNQSGDAISADLMMENLVDLLGKWSKIINKHGIIILESHCVPAKIANKYSEETESFSFDAIHSFSGLCLTEARDFFLAAAKRGLFPTNLAFRYPKTLPVTHISLNHFKKRNYSIRYATDKDLPVLVELEKLCWAGYLQTPRSTLEIRLQQYPEGQLALEMDSQTVGIIYTQKITDVTKLNVTPSEKVHELHTPTGDIVQLLAVNILPEFQNAGLGDQLLEFALQSCSLMNGLKSVVAVTLCRDYQKHTDIAIEDYIHFKDRLGKIVDPILRFHQLHGAQIKELVPNYRVKDKANNGYGVLVEYDIRNRERNEFTVESSTSNNQTASLEKHNIKDIECFLSDSIRDILGLSETDTISPQQPLMEMGLDSASLLTLNELMTAKYTINIEADFFFEYITVQQIIGYLQENIIMESDKEEPAESDKEEPVEPDNVTISEIQDSETAIEHQDSSIKNQDIAIVGMVFRFPGGSTTKEKFWQLLADKRSAVQTLPNNRWKWPSYINPNGKHKGIDKGGFLEDITNFDATFFRISPEEAEMMDPQQRILLELSWELFEDAGYKASDFFGSQTAVFIGASGSDYNLVLKKQMAEIEAHVGTGISMAIIPNRISYFYNFTGPSLQIDTACSSSLVAMHEGIKAIQSGESNQAIVGGINIICHSSTTIAYYRAGMLSKDGRCKIFDNEANGYVRGEGAGIVLIKPLSQAVLDKDNIYAVVKGSAINHGGQASGLTVPNPEKQAKLLVGSLQKIEDKS